MTFVYKCRFRLSERNWAYLLRKSREHRGSMSEVIRLTISEAQKRKGSGVSYVEPFGMEREISARLDFDAWSYLWRVANRTTKGNLSEALRRLLNAAEGIECLGIKSLDMGADV